ncbi:HicB family protein [Desulfamplus magnetovallimortis]|uniref:HicB family protein n=1 Tax=Desulfamplus magnetovallimortis TaxID=1246637 RepID=A0A1W1HJA2_9BACT|nr:type II toxin-antitoxin system HicB family antitoxin [Desulfamplus magnetovallimortis]SLM32452.1 HicB family protein [Desulfamplus magnetovallimortis]
MSKTNLITYKGYIGEISFDKDSKIFYGHVVNTKDTITFQSENAKELEKEFQVSVDTYLDFCKELGELPEKPYSGRFVLRLSPDAHRSVALAAQAANQTLNKWAAQHLIQKAEQELQGLN